MWVTLAYARCMCKDNDCHSSYQYWIICMSWQSFNFFREKLRFFFCTGCCCYYYCYHLCNDYVCERGRVEGNDYENNTEFYLLLKFIHCYMGIKKIILNNPLLQFYTCTQLLQVWFFPEFSDGFSFNLILK